MKISEEIRIALIADFEKITGIVIGDKIKKELKYAYEITLGNYISKLQTYDENTTKVIEVHPLSIVQITDLKTGYMVKTKWGWWGKITEINDIRHGQGIKILKYNDEIKVFSISPSDIIHVNLNLE